MGNLLDTLANTPAAKNGDWVETVYNAIQVQAGNIEQPEFRNAVIEAAQTLLVHKDDIANLGVFGLTLFLQKLAVGSTEDAYITFINTQATMKDLTDGENSDSASIISGKQKRDQMRAVAISIAEELALDGIRVLIPFLLAMI